MQLAVPQSRRDFFQKLTAGSTCYMIALELIRLLFAGYRPPLKKPACRQAGGPGGFSYNLQFFSALQINPPNPLHQGGMASCV
jgi:hypothetical protein